MQTTGKEPYSLYFHIPFCRSKCPYCRFYSVPYTKEKIEEFFKALIKEWQLTLPYLEKKRIVSIYFGGGTPSLLSPDDIESIINEITKSSLSIDSRCEITLEINPQDMTFNHFIAFKKAHINRLSIGVQSFDEDQLKILQRKHTVKDNLLAIREASRAGFENISIDLLYDLPMQNKKNFIFSLSHLSSLPISHVSLYNLVLEPNTLFFQKKKQLQDKIPSSQQSKDLLNLALAYLKENKFERYEISAFAKNHAYSKHNIGYWTGRSFWGFGPSAFSYWNQHRFCNCSNFSCYLEKIHTSQHPIDFIECLPFPKNIQELFIIGLRMKKGINFLFFQRRFGLFGKIWEEKIKDLKNKNLLKQNRKAIYLTKQGMLFYDSIAEYLIDSLFIEKENSSFSF